MMQDESSTGDNIFNMALERLKAIRNHMNGYAFHYLNDDPIKARGHLDMVYAEIYCDLDKEEVEESEEIQKEIAQLINKYNIEYSKVEENRKAMKRCDTTAYNKAKGELLSRLRFFYITKLIVYMNRHNLLKPSTEDPRFAAYG